MNEGRKLVTRRRALAGAGAIMTLGLAEYLSLRGTFDHLRPAGATGADWYRASLARLASDADAAAGSILHVGHSTHLLCVAGARLLTDPWFFDPAFGALSHAAGPAVGAPAIGALDAILVTHDHADHADLRAIDRLDKRAVALVATSDLAVRLRARGFTVQVLAPWESCAIGPCTVTAVPALHDIYEVGYVVAGAGRAVYFAGDTALHDDLPAIAERFSLSAAILPVDGTRVTGEPLRVMTPADAALAAVRLHAKLLMPSHAEARFSDPFAGSVLASTVEGAARKFAALVAQQLPTVPCALPRPGELVRVPS